MMDNVELTTWLNYLISINRMDTFYHSKYWRKIKREVLQEQHYECQHCKDKGKLTIVSEDIRKSGVVHHNKYVRDFPSLALSKYYIDDKGIKRRNLIVLCNECHEIVHDRFAKNEPLNMERW